MGLELAEQMGWRLPDVILYPTGGGTGLIGMAKALEELSALGWLGGRDEETQRRRDEVKKPRFYACQSSGCAPIVAAFDAGERFAKPFENARTIASGLRVPKAIGDFMILDAVRRSGGRAMAADEASLVEWMCLAARLEGIALCPESATCLDVLAQALRAGHIDRDETIVLFNTGAAQKYVETMGASPPSVPQSLSPLVPSS
jgi:threonine synthase